MKQLKIPARDVLGLYELLTAAREARYAAKDVTEKRRAIAFEAWLSLRLARSIPKRARGTGYSRLMSAVRVCLYDLRVIRWEQSEEYKAILRELAA